jgi:PAS domain S-box-containing protein
MADASGQVIKWCGITTDIEDRRRDEDALRARAERFHAIVDRLPAVVTLMTADGAFEHANHHMLAYMGQMLEDMQDRAVCDHFHPDDCPEVLARWRESVATGHPYDFEARLRRADGVYRWFHTRGSPLRDTDGRIVLWYLLHTDIDDRKRAEALLAGEKRLLEMVADGRSMSGILEALCQFVESTASGCYCSVVLVDPSGTRLEHGAAPSLPASFITSIIGRPVNVDSGPCAMAAYLNEQVIAADLTSETRWAAYAWCPMALAHGLQACWSTPISSTAGKVLGAFALYYDEPRTPTALHQSLIEQFTHLAGIAIERTRSEEALKRSEGFLAEAQHLSRTGSFVWRAATDDITWSKEMYRIYELDEAEPLTLERTYTRVHPEDLAMCMEQVARARREPVEADFEVRLRFLHGAIKHVRVVSHGARDAAGHVEYTGAVQDITDRRRAEDALEQLQSDLAHVARVTTLGALTASIAHEINQPLSGILTNASTCLRMLNADPPNVEGARETARRTMRDGHRASAVITRVRALFRKQDATTAAVDVNEATREVLALARSELQRSRVLVRADLADDLPPVTGDRVQLQQVILNLLLNAADALRGVDDRPRQVVLRTARDDSDGVRLSVQDAGVGFAAHDVERLFEAFYTTKSGGMGIGLAVSRAIIERHQGRLWAAPNEGPGATFAFALPRGREGVTGTDSPGATRTPAVTAAAPVLRRP